MQTGDPTEVQLRNWGSWLTQGSSSELTRFPRTYLWRRLWEARLCLSNDLKKHTYAQWPHPSSLAKHKSKDKSIKNLKMVTTEHQINVKHGGWGGGGCWGIGDFLLQCTSCTLWISTNQRTNSTFLANLSLSQASLVWSVIVSMGLGVHGSFSHSDYFSFFLS